MKSQFCVLIGLVLVQGHQALAKSAIKLTPQVPLSQSHESLEAMSALLSVPGQSISASLTDFAMASLSADERKELIVKLWEAQDVVEVMKMTGHGAGLDEERTIQVFGEDEPRKVTEGDKLRLKKAGFAFMDITDQPYLGELNAKSFSSKTAGLSLSLSPQVRASVELMFSELDDKYLREDIATLSGFWNRNYYTPWGLKSSNWIYDQVEGLFKTYESNQTTTSVTKFSHKFLQNSIIARIEAASSTVKDKKLIIISAHQDSLNYLLPFYRAPGADDDGSGSVTILQVMRSLLTQTFVPPPDMALEFHWFAAEEGGLLGSQDVAASYEKEGKKVHGMLHMDMTAVVKTGTKPIIGFFDTNTDANLTTFATKLVDSYVPLKWNMTRCGSSCGSDHMSFDKAGYPVAFATEGLFENSDFKTIHTAKDDLDHDGQYSFEHMLEFVKLGIAFMVELAAQSQV